MLAGRFLLIPLTLLAFGCSDGGTTKEKDLAAQPDSRSDGSAEDLLDATSQDVLPQPDNTSPDLAADTVLPPLEARLTPSGEPQNAAYFSLELVSFEDDEATIQVVAHGLGKVAGLAFTLQWEPQNLEFLGVQNLAQLGSSGAIETRSVSRVIQPGVLSFGAARFCLAKMPWGKVDQCGGVALDEDTPVAQFSFKVLSPGLMPLVFDADTSLVRRPDRSSVAVHWLNATLRVGR